MKQRLAGCMDLCVAVTEPCCRCGLVAVCPLQYGKNHKEVTCLHMSSLIFSISSISTTLLISSLSSKGGWRWGRIYDQLLLAMGEESQVANSQLPQEFLTIGCSCSSRGISTLLLHAEVRIESKVRTVQQGPRRT